MKKTGLIFILSAITLFSCSEKEVDLSPVDILTGGREKEWKVAEFFFSGEDAVQTQECYSDDTATFSKGNPLDSLNKESYYTYHKNEKKCGLIDFDESLPFHVSDDRKSIIFGANVQWDILKFEPTEFIMQTPDGLRRVRYVYTNPNTSTPKDTTGA